MPRVGRQLSATPHRPDSHRRSNVDALNPRPHDDRRSFIPEQLFCRIQPWPVVVGDHDNGPSFEEYPHERGTCLLCDRVAVRNGVSREIARQ